MTPGRDPPPFCTLTLLVDMGVYQKQNRYRIRSIIFHVRVLYVFSWLCVCVFFPFILDIKSLDVPAGVTQEEGHTGFLIHLLSAVRALIFLARIIQPFLPLVDREVEFCVLTI